jgi:transposase InsO family protein
MVYGVESICRVLPIAPSTYYRHAQKLQQPTLRVKRCVSDACLLAQIQTVWNDGLQVYGYWKVWRQLLRQGVQVAQAAQIKASVGTTGDSYDNALAETVNGLYKTEVIHHQKPWKRMVDVELATLNWVDWFNHRRLLGSIGYVPPAEFEMAYYRQLEESAKVA